MSKNENYQKILDLIGDEPKSQTEIREKIGKEKISIQGISKHLKRLIDKREIAYLGNKVNKLHTKILLRKHYSRKVWPENAKRVYISTPKSGELHKKLLKRFKKRNKDLIDEITRKYRVLEVISKFQDIYAPKNTRLKRDINRFYKERNKKISFNFGEEKNKFLRIIKFTPEMHWLAYKEEKARKEITFPMFAEMLALFNRDNKK